jgi:hypothetical protein
MTRLYIVTKTIVKSNPLGTRSEIVLISVDKKKASQAYEEIKLGEMQGPWRTVQKWLLLNKLDLDYDMALKQAGLQRKDNGEGEEQYEVEEDLEKHEVEED